MSKIRALLVAEAANPEWRSVPLIGWSHSQAISKLTDAHLVTQVRNRAALLRAGLVEGKDFTAIDSEKISRPMWKLTSFLRGSATKGWTTAQALSAVSYYYFEHLVWKQFAKQIKAGEIDVVHRITPMSPTIASILPKKCEQHGVPFVLGPLNGGLPWPAGFREIIHQEREWLSYLRDLHHYMPGYKSTRACSKAILAGSRDTFRQLPEYCRKKSFYVPENAVDPGRFTLPRQENHDGVIRVLFVGRLVPYKGADMLLNAAEPLLKSGKIEITIIGDGPERSKLESMAQESSASHRIHFTGKVPHADLQNYYAKSDLFAFPSIRELGGAVVLEAMCMGAVPIVVDYGGPPEFVKSGTGICLPMGNREQIIERLRDALETAASEPKRLDDLSRAAKRLVKQKYTWEAKALDVVDVYNWTLGRGDKPKLAPPGDDLCCGFHEMVPELPLRKNIVEPHLKLKKKATATSHT